MEYQSSFSQIPFLEIKNLRLRFKDMETPALSIDDLELVKGECVVLCGASGSGKSSFLKLLNGLIPEYYPALIEGEIRLNGQDLKKMDLEERSYQLASVFQNPATQFFHPTVLQELVVACENQGQSHDAIEERLARILAKVDLQPLLSSSLHHLSGGQKQQVALASAAMQGTDLILLDEPTANLDRQSIESLQSLLEALKAEGKTLLIAEHNLAYLSELADRYLYFHRGHLAMDYPAHDFLARTDICRKDMGLRCYDLSPYRREIADLEAAFSDDETGLLIENLTLEEGGKSLYCIDRLCLAAGQVVGVTGANGVGKSSLARYVSGLKNDRQSRISWQGQLLGTKKRLAKTAFVMQDVTLQLFTESVRKELLLANKTAVLDRDLLERLKLNDLLDRHPASLSGGEQQRLLLVANLLREKDLFIFDEPTSGLDLEQMREVARILRDLKARGKLVLLISHDEELLAQVADKILAITGVGD